MKKHSLDSLLSATTTGGRIQELRLIAGLSRPKFARLHHISFPTLRSWELEISTVSGKLMSVLLRGLRSQGILITEEWLRTGNGNPPVFTTPELFNIVVDDAAINPIQPEVDAFLKNNPDACIITAGTNYPALNIKSGDFVGGVSIAIEDLTLGQVIYCIVVRRQPALESTHPAEQGNKNQDKPRQDETTMDEATKDEIRQNEKKLRKSKQPRTEKSDAHNSRTDDSVAGSRDNDQVYIVQKLDDHHAIIAPLNTAHSHWHHFIFPLKSITALYHVCWIRNIVTTPQ